MRYCLIFLLFKISKTLLKLFSIFEFPLNKFGIRTDDIFNLQLQLASFLIVRMLLLLLTLGYVEESQQIAFQGFYLQYIVQACAVNLKFFDFVNDNRILQLFFSIETFHYEQKLVLIFTIQEFKIYCQLVSTLFLRTQRNILKQIHQKLQSLILKFLTKNNTDLSRILRISIEKRLSKAIIEAILRIGVAVRDIYKVVSDCEDALLTDIPVEEIHAILGLTHGYGVLYRLPQQNIQLDWPILEQGSAGGLWICALYRQRLTVTSTWIIHPTSEGSQMKVFPLNSSASVINPFLMRAHRKWQGTCASSSRDAKTERERMVDESILSGVCLTQNLQLLKLSASFPACFEIQSTTCIIFLYIYLIEWQIASDLYRMAMKNIEQDRRQIKTLEYLRVLFSQITQQFCKISNNLKELIIFSITTHRLLQILYNLILIQTILRLNNKIILQMSKLKKASRSKPNLFVEIEDFQKKISDFKEGSGKNNVTIKPLCSDKNVHELKRFNFDDCHVDAVSTERKMQKLQQLQEQKCTLMQSLQILKASAVSAIAEKEDEIQRLKVFDHFSVEEKLQYYETELNRSQRLQQELEDEKNQIYQEFSEERSKHLSELEEKQYLIEAMYQEMSEIRRDLQNLEQNDIAKTKKIKLLQEENSKLSIELEELSLTNSLTHISDKMDLDQTIKMRAPSVISSIHSQHCFSLNESNEHIPFDGSYISQRMEEMNKGHKEDLLELKNFYEKRIAALREIYERQLNLPTQESEKDQCYSHNSRLTKKHSRRSLKRGYQEPGLNINLRDMYSIEEHAEEFLETERTKMHDLKYEIKMQNLSECPSVQPRLRTQQDMDVQSVASHFTAKYFEMPVNRFLKKNKSSSTFNPEESKTILKINHKQSADLKGDQEELQSIDCQQNFWNKTKIFAAGMLSGVTITALTAVFLSKK